MEVRELDQRQYDQKLRAVIVGTEGLHAHVRDVGDDRATIGWGYTLNRNNNVEIWTRAGLELSAEQLATLERVDRAPRAAKTQIGLGFDRILSEAESDMLFRASLAEYEGPAVSAGLPLSDERIAMVSVTYNRGVGALRDHSFTDAVREENRAEAWYQLRYNCWGSRADMEGGLRKRRFAKSEVFGLYDDRANVSVEEAASVYAMYRTHRAEIDRVERDFGVNIEGLEARPNRIAQANRDYPGIVEEYGAIRTISDSLAPARTVLLAHLQTHYPDHASDFTEARFNAAEIDLDRFPIRRRAPAHVEASAPQDDGADSNTVHRRISGPFEEPFLNELLYAVSRQDSTSARDITLAFIQSPRGETFRQQGDHLVAQRQADPLDGFTTPAAKIHDDGTARG